jgi:hypothetical protein
MSDTELTLRRAVLQLQPGQPKSVEIDPPSAGQLKNYVESFARRKKIGLTTRLEGSQLIMERGANLVSTLRYGEMDGLAVGESHVFKVGIPEHAAVRRMASYRNRDGSGRAFRCTVDSDGLRVTRMPATDAERQATPLVSASRRPTKYGLERLVEVGEIRFDLPRKDHQRLRMAVHQFGLKMEWKIRCRIQDDGAMLVVRIKDAS